ncbi:MAG: hypothetical protein KIG34_01340 [Bacteroidales bacterium]|nr:hypothetical protein [Bacteroidales bacterium]
MKAFRTIVLAGLAVLAAASCEKATVSDAVVSFEQDSYVCFLEEGPNFSVPVKVSGANVTYPMTVKIVDIPAADDNDYSERNVDYRFLERELVINSAEETPAFTVRIINNEESIFDIALKIETVSAGSIGQISQTEILIAPEVAFYSGSFAAKGTNNGKAHTEQWDFVFGKNNAIGFWGLLGETEAAGAKYPVTGTMVKEEGKTFFVFPLGVDNAVGAYYFDLPEGMTACIIAPIVVTDDNRAYTGGELPFQALDTDNYAVGLDEGEYLSYGLFDNKSGKFMGYTTGDKLSVESVTRIQSAQAQAATAACMAKRDASGITVSGLKDADSVTKIEKASDSYISR